MESSLHENSGSYDSLFADQSETIVLPAVLLVAAKTMQGYFCLAYGRLADPRCLPRFVIYHTIYCGHNDFLLLACPHYISGARREDNDIEWNVSRSCNRGFFHHNELWLCGRPHTPLRYIGLAYGFPRLLLGGVASKEVACRQETADF